MNGIVNGIDAQRFNRTRAEVGKRLIRGGPPSGPGRSGGLPLPKLHRKGLLTDGMKKMMKFVVESDEPPALGQKV